MDELEDFLAHTITVRTKLGTGSYGPIYAEPVTLTPEDGTGVLVDEETRLVRAADGTEAVSSTTIVARVAQADALTPGSRVTLPSGDETTILSRSVATTPGLDDMPEHVEAACE
ncbi:hypothetical protein [Ornithinimicrobium sufpigmenti]|uniref:hypothetical protein n=1 Tax=Ornithinimicrobium sufpigmenti TaxID=2508882 RepID=UPI001036549D|nr:MULTISPECIES: hypothetical protein [unclassified Ornithinimicrobium]